MNGPHFLFDAEHVLPIFPKQDLDVQIVDGEHAARLLAQHFALCDPESAS
ncbi:hypothetical protein [Variovorax sp. AFSI2.2]